MIIYLQLILCNVSSLWLLLLLCVLWLNVDITFATSSAIIINNDYGKRVDEFFMTSAAIDGIKRSNVCGDGYRIEGALLKSYPYSKRQTYLPYEDCYMTFKARRSYNQIRIRIVTLNLNDIRNGINCLDSLRFYQSVYIKMKDKLNSVECGQISEAENFTIVSPTGIVTAHFSTDGGNVSGLGFKVILTSFRYPNKTHQCDPNDDEFLCNNGECISSLLLCDGITHCLDGSDEIPYYSCNSDSIESNNIQSNYRTMKNKHRHWRGILVIAFLLIILIAFTIFMIYFVCRRCFSSSVPLDKQERKYHTTIVNSNINGPRSPSKAKVIIKNNNKRECLDDDYNSV